MFALSFALTPDVLTARKDDDYDDDEAGRAMDELLLTTSDDDRPEVCFDSIVCWLVVCFELIVYVVCLCVLVDWLDVVCGCQKPIAVVLADDHN
jgi:hypothetical protein